MQPIKNPQDLKNRIGRRLKNAVSPGPPWVPEREVYLAIAELNRRRGHPESMTNADLSPYELKVFSQHGEDGVLAEMLRRSGDGDRSFVEFGAEEGTEGNCVYLADVLGWRGVFIEGNADSFTRLARKYEANDRVTTSRNFVTATSVESLFESLGVPQDLDVLSIDVDGSDYWIWKAITSWQPRIVVIEYNALLGTRQVVQPQSVTEWDGTDYYGASISAMRSLGEVKGYRLVHTELTGNNAFFVRSDLSGSFLDADDVTLRSPNFNFLGRRHPQGEGSYESI